MDGVERVDRQSSTLAPGTAFRTHTLLVLGHIPAGVVVVDHRWNPEEQRRGWLVLCPCVTLTRGSCFVQARVSPLLVRGVLEGGRVGQGRGNTSVCGRCR